ncbi:MAG: D-alanine--D-alanine ligase [Candidatus Omnitrophica bacterium]|nr:D-alanine--D-alanine ligase [Candidatus Omnitrophota bacterium]
MDKSEFGKIGVLAGGPSNEREISLRSGRAVYSALIEEGLDVAFIDMTDESCAEIKSSGIDAAFVALHGKFGEDGTVQKMLEDAGIPYTGSGVEASRLALDKIASKEAFAKKGIPSPRYRVLEKGRVNTAHTSSIRLPAVIKPQFEGSSIGLSVVRERAGLKAAIEKAFLYGARAVVEEYIDGRELTVGMLDDEPLPVIEIVTKDKIYDYRAKYSDPDTRYIVPAPVEKGAYGRAQALGAAAHKALGCRSFSRVDMLIDGRGELFVLEVNTIPGMTERSLLPKAAAAKGISFSDLCVKLVENAVKNCPQVKR